MNNRPKIDSMLKQIDEIARDQQSLHEEFALVRNQMTTLSSDPAYTSLDLPTRKLYLQQFGSVQQLDIHVFDQKNEVNLKRYQEILNHFKNLEPEELTTAELSSQYGRISRIETVLNKLQTTLDHFRQAIAEFRDSIKGFNINTQPATAQIKSEKIIEQDEPIYQTLLNENIMRGAQSVFHDNSLNKAVAQSSGNGTYTNCLKEYMNWKNLSDDDSAKSRFIDSLIIDNQKPLADKIKNILDSDDYDGDKIDNLMILNYLNDNDRTIYIKNMKSLNQTWNLLQNFDPHIYTKKTAHTASIYTVRAHLAKGKLETTANIDEALDILKGNQDKKEDALRSRKSVFSSFSMFISESEKNKKSLFKNMTQTIDKINTDLKNTAVEFKNTSIKRPGK